MKTLMYIKRAIKITLMTMVVVVPLMAQFQLPFSDNFNDGDDSDWLWYTDIGPSPGGQPSHQVVNGVERIVTHDQNNTLLANGASNLSNYYVEADMRITQLLDDVYGGLRIYAYANGGIGDTSSYYVLDICHRENRWGLSVRYSDGSSESLAHGSLSVSTNHWYHMKLEVRGDTVFAYLDGQMLGWGVPSQPLSGGYFGFGGADDIIEVDNVHADASINNTPGIHQVPIYHSGVSQSYILNLISNDGAGAFQSNFNGKVFVYKFTLIGGGGYYSSSLLKINFNHTPLFVIGKGTSDDAAAYRVSIGVDTLNMYGFNERGWVDLTSHWTADSIFVLLDSKWGTNYDTELNLWMAFSEPLDTSITYDLIRYNDSFDTLYNYSYQVYVNPVGINISQGNSFSGDLSADGASSYMSNFTGNYAYRIEIWGGGGYYSDCLLKMYFSENANYAIAIGTSDANDNNLRTGVGKEVNHLIDVQQEDWVNITGELHNHYVDFRLNSKWGTNQDSHIILWMSTDNELQDLGYSISMFPEGLGSISVKEYSLAANSAPVASVPTGPSSGNVGQSLTYHSTVTDPDGDQVTVQFDWGDGTTSNWSGYYPSGHTFDVAHSWSSPGTYHVRARGKDSHGNIGSWSSYKTVTISQPQNNPPTASTPSGPSSGNVGESLTYHSTVTDPDEDQVAVQFDWGDGTTSDWSNYYSSGHTFDVAHSWNSPGTYHVRARGKDSHGNIGSWSSYLTVTISNGTGVQVSIPDTSAHAGDTVDIPVYIGNVTGLEIYSFQLNICSPSFMIPDSVLPGSMTSSWGNPIFNLTDSCVSVAMAGASPLNGSGDLIWVRYLIAPDAQVGDNGEIRITSIQFNEGSPSATPINGSVVILPNVCVISGHITYAVSNLPVPGVILTVNGDSGGITNEQGMYSLQEDFGGVYMVKPEKEDDINSSISAYDASLILRYNVGRADLTPIQMIAADVSGNGAISAFDASYILRYNVGRIHKFPVMEDSLHFWRFIPQSFPLDSANWRTAPDNITYNPLQSDQTDQDYYAIVYGDVSHNWSSSGKGAKGSEIPRGELSIPGVEREENNLITIPVEIHRGSNIYSINMNIVFDTRVLDFVNVRKGLLDGNFSLVNNVENGVVRIAMAGVNSIEGDGSILYVTFRVRPGANIRDEEKVRITNIMLNEFKYSEELTANVSTGEERTFKLIVDNLNLAARGVHIRYQVPRECWVKIDMFNSLGQRMKTVVNSKVKVGIHDVELKENGLKEGVYFIVMRAENHKIVRKFIFIRR